LSLGAYPYRAWSGKPAHQRFELRKVATDEISRHGTETADWIFETGPAVFGFLFGDYENARAAFKAWVCRSFSEFADRSAIMAFYDNQAAGVLIAFARDEVARRLGIDRKLLECAIDDGTALGFCRFRLDVETENSPANALYNSVGFRRIRVGVIEEPGLEMSSLLLKK